MYSDMGLSFTFDLYSPYRSPIAIVEKSSAQSFAITGESIGLGVADGSSATNLLLKVIPGLILSS
jgi:hypothetical protein